MDSGAARPHRTCGDPVRPWIEQDRALSGLRPGLCRRLCRLLRSGGRRQRGCWHGGNRRQNLRPGRRHEIRPGHRQHSCRWWDHRRCHRGSQRLWGCCGPLHWPDPGWCPPDEIRSGHTGWGWRVCRIRWMSCVQPPVGLSCAWPPAAIPVSEWWPPMPGSTKPRRPRWPKWLRTGWRVPSARPTACSTVTPSLRWRPGKKGPM